MRRRSAVQAPGEPPPYLRRLDPERYRQIAEDEVSRGRWSPPGATFTIAMAVWRAWCAERREWCRANGVGYEERRELLGPVRPAPFAWVAAEFGTEPLRRE